MFRFGLIALFGIALVAFVSSANPSDDAVEKALSVQAAMVRARALLSEMKAHNAVDVLEEALPKVNNNPQYLALLRDSYRAYVHQLYLAGQPDTAKRYLDRLCILDPAAANDSTLRPQKDMPPRKFEPEPVKEAKGPGFPHFKMPALPNFFGKKEEPKTVSLPPTSVRALPDEAINTDPFDAKLRREAPFDGAKANQARDLLSRGLSEFGQKKYADARICFEQAVQADRACYDSCKEPWAYCILDGVTKAMEQPGVLPAKIGDLKQEVEGAIRMAPTKVMAPGQALLEHLDKRANEARPPQIVASVTATVRHLGGNREGWQVAETPHFRIFHKQNAELAERVAKVAESTRTAMYRKWFGSDGVEWDATCELILHPTAAAYTQMTGVPGNSPGHSRIECDAGRVIARRMDLRLDQTGALDAVLPHEATHVVLAGMFGSDHVPRWADEGIAVLSEPNDKIDQHRRSLQKLHRDGQLFGLKELMELKDYPQARRVGAFYAQSVVLVEFLTQQKGPKTLTDFVKDGLRQGYDASLQRHYGMTFAQLEDAWQRQVLAGERMSSLK